MKTVIENVTGLVIAGHMAIRTDGATIVESPDNRVSKLKGLVRRACRLSYCDRVVSASDFVQATGCTVTIAGKTIKPMPVKRKKNNINVVDLLK